MASDALALNTNSLTTTTNSTASTTTTESSAEDDLDDFMTLLLTQLEHQDPMDPVDTTEWTDQLTQYSQLEQQVATNEKLDELIVQGSTTTSAELSYLGTTVETSGGAATAQNGAVNWSYEAPSDAEAITLDVRDSNGVVVHSETVYAEDGKTQYSLTLSDLGEGAQNGDQYTLSAEAYDDDGEELDVNVTSYSTIDGIDMSGSETILLSGDYAIAQSSILRVYS